MFSKLFTFTMLSVSLLVCQNDACAQSTKQVPSSSTFIKKPERTNGFAIGPAPSWVNDLTAKDESGVGGIYYRLVDEQVRLDGNEQTRYSRIVKVANDVSGLPSVGNIRVIFDPSYQVLTFNRIDIVRAGKHINALDGAKIKVLQRETNLEQQVYDGRVTATISLEDLRVGDALDLAYTVKGGNPVFGGKYVDTIWMLGAEGGTGLARFRLLAPDNRTIHFRASANTEVQTHRTGPWVDTVFLRKAVQQLQGDDATPGSYYLKEQIRLSEFTDWQQIAAWGRSLFDAAGAADSADLQNQVLKIKALTASPEEQVRMALDFVQKDVRYFATEVGPYSHQPVSSSKVLSQRFGDCKDKTALLIAMLRGLGVTAAPALASLRLRNGVDADFPTPYAFDHAIAQVHVGGKTYWLDGTRALQEGPLALRESVGLGKTLVLDPSATLLNSTPDGKDMLRLRVEDVIAIRSWQAPAHLTSSTTFYADLAESVRYLLGQESNEKVQFALSAELARSYPNLERDKPLVVENLPDDNAIRVTQTFTLPKFWRFPDQRVLNGDYALWGLVAQLRFANEVNRTRPYQLSLPGTYAHTVRFDFPEVVSAKPGASQKHESNRQLDLAITSTTKATSIAFDGNLRIKDNLVDANEWSRYTDFLRKNYPMLAGTIAVPSMSQEQANRANTEIRELVKSWDGFFASSKPKTRVQSDSHIQRLVLTAQINGGRLNSELLAQALRQRGIQLDQIGQYREAKADFQKALQIAPENAEILADAAVNAFGLKEDAVAFELIKKAIAINPNDLTYYRTLARLNYFGGNYAEARRNTLEAMKDTSKTPDGYALIYLSLIAKRLKENPASAIAPYYKDKKTEWPYPVLQGVISTTEIDDVFKAANADSKDASNLCEAYYYAAESLLIEGKPKQAKAYFEKAVDTGVVEYVEYEMAKRRLAELLSPL
jgi:lipoprotein NlpI/transglutaminase-like putative cysteine protease